MNVAAHNAIWKNTFSSIPSPMITGLTRTTVESVLLTITNGNAQLMHLKFCTNDYYD